MGVAEITLTSDITVRCVQQVGGDEMVVAAARVSTCGEAALAYADPSKAEESAGLIRYLMRCRHGSVFEHSLMTFFVHAPIFTWREWHRHRIGFAYSEQASDSGLGQSFNEESARYKPLDPVFWIPRRDRAMIPVNNWKPGRPKFVTLDEWVMLSYAKTLEDADAKYAREVERDRRVYQLAYDSYQESIADGIALEVARCKLPVAIYSSCWVTTNPRAIMAFLSLRTQDERATYPSYPQAEIAEASRACEQVFAAGWPITYAAWNEFGRVAP